MVRLLIALTAFLIVLLVTGWPVAALAAALAVIFLPKLASGREARRRTATLEALEQWARRLADMLTASRALEDALEASARTAPPAITGQVGALARRLSARTGTETALRAFAADIDDPAGDRIAAALIIATSRRGRGAHAVLSALAEMLGRDVAARREIDAERAQHRTTVRWITVFILGFTIFAVLNWTYSAPYGTVAYQIVLAMVAGLYAAGPAWLHRLGTIPAPGRFPRSASAGPGFPAGPAPSRPLRSELGGAGEPVDHCRRRGGLLGVFLLVREAMPSRPAAGRRAGQARRGPGPPDGEQSTARPAVRRLGAAVPWLPVPSLTWPCSARTATRG
jgi:Flp pilus assembly protein TadB